MTITPAILTIVADSQTKIYGTNDPGLTDTATGFVNATIDGVAIDDNAASVLTGSIARAQAGTLAGEQAGGYAITQGTLEADDDYTISFTGSTLTITPATLAVAASSTNKDYGTNDPTFSTTVTGLVNATVDGVPIDDTVADVLTGSPARAGSGTLAGEQVGGYAITQGTLAANSNYTISFTGGTLTITPATLTVAANSADQGLRYERSDPDRDGPGPRQREQWTE